MSPRKVNKQQVTEPEVLDPESADQDVPEVTDQEAVEHVRRLEPDELKRAEEKLAAEKAARKSRIAAHKAKKLAEQRTSRTETIWKPQYREDGRPGPQVALVTCPFDEILFGGARGGGKGSSMDSLVMTPFGWRKMGDLRLGQAVSNPDGSVSQIIGIHPLGVRQLYRVTFHDGTSTEVTDDHVWLTWKSNKSQKSGGVRQSGQDSARLWTTKAMMDDMKVERKVSQNFLIPITQPVAVTDVSRYPRRPIPPYLLGVLLGDGHMRDEHIRFSKPDKEIAERIDRILQDQGYEERLMGPYEAEGKCLSWGLSVSKDSAIFRHLQKFNLIGTLAVSKFIPEPYLLGNIEERWELLRGLMDTDGWSEEDGDIYFGTSSPQLRDGVSDLARSLGAVVTIREKEPFYTYKGERLQGQTAWTLRIKLPTPSMAFHLERKKAKCQRAPQSMFRMIVSIEPSRVAESQCIQVNHPNGLYLTNDYIVTHNTDGALGCWLQHVARYGENAKGVFFRRRFKQLEEVQSRCMQLFPKLGALYHKGDALWIFPSGASLKLRHLWDEQSCEEYQGHSYSFLVFEEVTNWGTPNPILKLSGTLRSAQGVKPQMILTANPGGSGHNWCKARFRIAQHKQGYVPIVDEETGLRRIYIPSRLEDNVILMKNDPNYEKRLLQSGNSALVKAWRWGDWDIVSGGFFDDIFDPDRHIVPPFDIPSSWKWRRSFDWGSAAPASLGIWAIADGNPIEHSDPKWDGFVFPRGSLIRVAEWYTVSRDVAGNIRPNEGLRLTNIALGNGIGQRSMNHSWSGCVADPSIFAKPGRDSIYDEMRKGAMEVGHILNFQPADNNRIAGWQRVRDMLEAAAKEIPEKPGIWALETCEHYIRTIPVLQRKENELDDIDTDQEDHCLHGDTPVETRAGPIPIKHLVGTEGEVLSINGQWKRYTDCRMTRAQAECARVTVADGRSFIATLDHRVLTGSDWVEVANLLGETIVTPFLNPKGTEVVAVDPAGVHAVYNLEVEDTQAFAICGGLIVHNCADEVRYIAMTGPRVVGIGKLTGT